MEVKLDSRRLAETKCGRNSGRTFDALHEAVLKTGKYSQVVFVGAYQSELNRLGRDIEIICEYYAIPFKEVEGGKKYLVGESVLLTLSAHWGECRGCRAYFVLDHSCRDDLLEQQFQYLLDCLSCAHSGDHWPPAM